MIWIKRWIVGFHLFLRLWPVQKSYPSSLLYGVRFCTPLWRTALHCTYAFYGVHVHTRQDLVVPRVSLHSALRFIRFSLHSAPHNIPLRLCTTPLLNEGVVETPYPLTPLRSALGSIPLLTRMHPKCTETTDALTTTTKQVPIHSGLLILYLRFRPAIGAIR